MCYYWQKMIELKSALQQLQVMMIGEALQRLRWTLHHDWSETEPSSETSQGILQNVQKSLTTDLNLSEQNWL